MSLDYVEDEDVKKKPGEKWREKFDGEKKRVGQEEKVEVTGRGNGEGNNEQ
jgi:hypothetical protein